MSSDKGRRVFHAGPDGTAQVNEVPAGHEEGSGALEEMSFSAHVVSLHATALLYLGEVPDEGGQALPPDKEAARHVIDTLDMLKRKTRGNLTPEEANLLDGILYELRVKFVQCK